MNLIRHNKNNRYNICYADEFAYSFILLSEKFIIYNHLREEY
jgi:hypothetical protein